MVAERFLYNFMSHRDHRCSARHCFKRWQPESFSKSGVYQGGSTAVQGDKIRCFNKSGEVYSMLNTQTINLVFKAHARSPILPHNDKVQVIVTFQQCERP